MFNASNKLNIRYLKRVAKAYHRDKEVIQRIDNIISIAEDQLGKDKSKEKNKSNTNNSSNETKTDEMLDEMTITTEKKDEEEKKNEMKTTESNELLQEWNNIGKTMRGKYGYQEHAILNSRIDTSLSKI